MLTLMMCEQLWWPSFLLENQIERKIRKLHSFNAWLQKTQNVLPKQMIIAGILNVKEFVSRLSQVFLSPLDVCHEFPTQIFFVSDPVRESWLPWVHDKDVGKSSF